MPGALCTHCHEYPAGSACAATGCPGRPFNKTPAPRPPSSDNASGTHQGHAAEVTNDGGTTGFITRRESMAMASGGRVASAACPPQISETYFREPGRTTTGARAGSLPSLPAQPPCIADNGWDGWPFEAFPDPRAMHGPSSQPIGDRLALVKLAGRA